MSFFACLQDPGVWPRDPSTKQETKFLSSTWDTKSLITMYLSFSELNEGNISSICNSSLDMQGRKKEGLYISSLIGLLQGTWQEKRHTHERFRNKIVLISPPISTGFSVTKHLICRDLTVRKLKAPAFMSQSQ